MATSSRRALGLWWPGWAVTAVWGLSYIGARGALDRDFRVGPDWLRVLIALIPLLPTIAFLGVVIASLRAQDELHRRVQLEALAFAYPLALVFLMTLGLIELAVGLSPENWSYRQVWVFLPLFYFLGLGVAWRRYR